MLNIEQVLSQNPGLKSYAASQAETARLDWLEAKEALKKQEAQFALQTKAMKPKITATEIKYIVDNHPDIHVGRLNLVRLESSYRVFENEVQFRDDEFTAAKVLARIKISEMKTIEGVI